MNTKPPDLIMDIQLFIPCFMDQLYPETAFNTVKVLEKAGCKVHYNESQTCCGQPAFNAGFHPEAQSVCSKFLNDFKTDLIIVTPSASCAGFVRNYYDQLFEKSTKRKELKATTENVFELTDFLVNKLGISDLGASFQGKATYHDSCAGLREYKLDDQPRKLLSQVKGLELVEMADNRTCCGFGGTFAVKFESISVAMGDQKSKNAAETSADYLISTDTSCLMHIQGVMNGNGNPMKCLHIADVLASGY
jgi:L-lactate dehydrogenase complex protein LldE